jgi:transcriptional regulator with GAF, ATPase, and Fis domain
MTSDRDRTLARGEEFLQMFRKGAEFTRELLEENEKLRFRLAEVEEQQESAAQSPEEWEKLRQHLLNRVQNLEAECRTFQERISQVEDENRDFVQRFIEVEEENNNLANLYVASYQLHSTLDLEEVLQTIIEIVINLIGAEVFAVYLLDEDGDELAVAACEGAAADAFPRCTPGRGALGKALGKSEPTCWDMDGSGDLSQPIVCIPLVVERRQIGAIAIYSLLQQKEGFSHLDHELFAVLGGHAATALLAAKLYTHSERRLSTIQGFIDLLAK